MKYLLLSLALVLTSLASNAQTNPGNKMTEPSYYQEGNNLAMREAGTALRKHTRQYYIGTGLMVGGYTLLTAAGITSATGSFNSGLATVGFLTTAAGSILQIISHRHIGRAGEILERATASNSIKIQPASTGPGLGLAYHF